MDSQLSHRVLLVEDNLAVRKLIARCLLAEGYVVRTAGDGLDAIAKLRTGLPDLIISDLGMPGMSGPEFLAVVRKRFPQIPVITISSASEDEIPKGLDTDAYCKKGGLGGFEELLATVSALAGGPPPRRAPPATDGETAQARWDGASRCLVRCSDCFREFAVSRIVDVRAGTEKATCVHCGNCFEIFVAEGAGMVMECPPAES